MTVKMTMLTPALAVFALLGSNGFAQDVGGIDPSSVPPGTAGHTLDELRKGIKEEAQRVGQKLGEVGHEIKDEASHVSSEVAQKFETVKSEVWSMPAHHRIYSRIHWDKSLHNAKVEVQILREGVVLLTGTVPTEAAKRHASAVVNSSVGVAAVINELKVTAPAPSSPSAAAPKSSTRR